MRITHELYHSASPSALDMPKAEMGHYQLNGIWRGGSSRARLMG
jgi:hypothetical protein